VLVAHNAPFDLGFLKAGCERLDLVWPAPDSVDTAGWPARPHPRRGAQLQAGDPGPAVPQRTTPDHRALSDARATVDVLHGLLARVGGLGVQSLEELRTFSSQVSPQQRRKRHLADGLPAAPGVYLFRDARGRVLYVGKSTNLRGRVRQYFTASETRTRMAEMVGLAEQVDPVVCSTPLEAEVRELRLIAEHSPRYNRRSKRPDKATWIKLTTDAFPRLSLVRTVLADDALYLGPFSRAATAELAVAAAHEALPLRQCTKRISVRVPGSACVLAEMRRCGAPCLGPGAGESPAAYAVHAQAYRTAVGGDPSAVVERLTARITALSAAHRYEDAAAQRDRLTAFVRRHSAPATADGAHAGPAAGGRPADRGPRLGGRRRRHGRLVSAGTVARGVRPGPTVDALVATAETVLPRPGPLPAATAEEVECVLRWLEAPGTRLVRLEGTWASPAFGAGGQRAWLEAAQDARAAVRPFDDRRRLRPEARPARAARVGRPSRGVVTPARG
jgi:DNA polymerase-3 subunit epsilon